MDIRNFFFKNRSFTPIPIAVSIIYFAQPDNHNVLLGFAVLLVGELIRMWSVSYAGGETIFSSLMQDISIFFILVNQGVIIGYLTWYKD